MTKRLTSGQHVPRDGVGDGSEDPVELSEGRASVVEPARDPATQHNTDGIMSAAHTACHRVYSEQKRSNCSALLQHHVKKLTFESTKFLTQRLAAEYSCVFVPQSRCRLRSD